VVRGIHGLVRTCSGLSGSPRLPDNCRDWTWRRVRRRNGPRGRIVARPQARSSDIVCRAWLASRGLTAALATPALIPHIGWRGMFLFGVLPAFVAFGVRHYLGEPALFVAATKIEPINPFTVLFADRAAIRATAGIAIMTSAQNFGYYGMMIWLPAYLSSQLDFSLRQSALWISLTVAGGAVGMCLFGQLADRIGRKPLFISFQAGAMVMAFIYPQVTNSTMLLLVGAITGVFSKWDDRWLRRSDRRKLSNPRTRHGPECAL
jgi:MFS family permease